MKNFHLYLIVSTFILASCGGGGGGGGGSAPTTPTTPAPTVNLSAEPTSVLLESTSTLTWSSTNATSCSASWTSQTGTSGSEVVTITTAGSNSFSITCSGAGGSRSDSVTVEGYRETDGVVVDGYISGAEVCIDEDESWTCDSNENSTTSDNEGKFTIRYANGNLVSIGGTDLDSQTLLDNLLITHKLTGHSDFKAVTPVTSIAAFMEDASLVNAALGIDSSIDVFTFDPVANKGDGGINDYLYEKGNQLTVLAFALQNITNNLNTTTETTQDYFKAITKEIEKEYTETETKVDIETETFITKALDNVIAAKSVTIDETAKANTTKALASVLPVIEVKPSDDLTTGVIRFALSTLQTDIQAIANGTATAETVTSYTSDVLAYIAEDQKIDADEIAPDISAIADSATTSEDTAVEINVLLNDSYLTSSPISVTAGNGTNGITSVASNIVTYDPDADYNGTDTFSYTITQGDKTSSADVTVTIEAVNDEPSIDIALTIQVAENQTAVTTVSVSDVDEDELTLTLGGTDADSFNLSDENVLTFKEAPDYEIKDSYSITLTLTDGIETVTKDVTISITNENDNSPIITSSSTFSADENQTAIGTVTATDADGNGITYTVTGSDVNINPSTGILSFKTAPDYEIASKYTITVTATDEIFSDSQEITININNLNDNSPLPQKTTFNVNENSINIGNINAVDADGDEILYSIESEDIAIDEQGLLTFISAPDYETKSNYTANVTISDGLNEYTFGITISIINLNEYGPALSSPTSYSIIENETVIGTVTATDPEGDRVYYRLDQDSQEYAGINEDNGFLYFKSPPNYENKNSYILTLLLSDGQYELAYNITINITDTYGKLIGEEVYGSTQGDELGWISAFNNEGNRIAVSSYKNNSNRGYVKVFSIDTNTNLLRQLGGDLRGDNVGDFFGDRVVFNDVGNIIAISSTGSNSNAGHVSIYQLNGNSWDKLGSTIEGSNSENSGIGLDLSSDGKTIAIGSPNYKKENSFNYPGRVRIYQYDESLSEWSQKANLIGEGAGPNFGKSLSLNSDGTRIAIGAPKDNDSGQRDATGSVYVFDSTFNNGSWDQYGNDIDGENKDDLFGESVSLSGDGTMLAIGSPGYERSGNNETDIGKVEIYQYGLSNGSFKWHGPWGETLYGDLDSDYFGYYSKFSKDGKILAVGGLGQNSVGLNKFYEKTPINNSDTYFDMKIIELVRGNLSDNNTKISSVPSISKDGKVYAIGYPMNSEKTNKQGKISIYEMGGIYGDNGLYSSNQVFYLYGSYLGETQYLGCYGCLSTSSDSICNSVGNYGSNVSATSIWNVAGSYGNTVNNSSPWNSVGTEPPEIFNQDKTTSFGLFSANTSISNRTKSSDLLDILNKFSENQNVTETREYACEE
tara:strand:+ start:234 stop:4397 length:4164 start_codon:yes stop_codon:yes gene_type:complete